MSMPSRQNEDERRGGTGLPFPLLGSPSIPAACSTTVRKNRKRVLVSRSSFCSGLRGGQHGAGLPRPPSTRNALTFTEEARRRSIYWLASWLAQNSHL
jgi:hypothetical protein